MVRQGVQTCDPQRMRCRRAAMDSSSESGIQSVLSDPVDRHRLESGSILDRDR
jgi:hypothetical protein